MTRHSSRIVVLGYFGRVNLGDELMLEAFLTDIFRLGCRAEDVVVVSRGYSSGAQRAGVRQISERAVPSLALSLDHPRAFVLCGGSLMLSNLKATAAYAMIENAAKARGSRVMLYGVGVEPDPSALAVNLCKWRLRAAEHIVVRDNDSYTWFHDFVRDDKLALGADPIIGLALEMISTGVSPAQGSTDRVSVIPISPTAGKYIPVPVTSDEVVRLVLRLLEEYSEVDLVAFSNGEGDTSFIRSTRAQLEGQLQPRVRCIDASTWSLAETLMYVRSCRMVVSMRYHGLLLAGLCGVPAVALDRTRKVRQVASTLGMPLTTIGRFESEVDLDRIPIPRTEYVGELVTRFSAVNLPRLKEMVEWLHE